MQNDGRSFDVVRPSTTTQAVPYVPAPVQTPPVFTPPKPQPTYRVPTPYVPQMPPPQNVQRAPRRVLGMRLPWVIGISAALGLLIVGGIAAYIFRAVQPERLQATDFNPLSVPLGNVTGSALTAQAAKSLKVNGQLKVTDSLILSPTTQPQNAVAGQLYYDQAINQLAFYNGQQFVSLGTTTAGTTNVTNVLGGTGSNVPGVQLQATTPGIQQAGNFNIAGIGQVGTLKTTIISSGGGSLFVNPVSISVGGKPEGVPTNIGLDTLGGTTEPSPGWQNGLSAQKVTLGDTGGKVKSMSVHFIGGSSSSHVQFGVYEDDGDVPSKPGARVTASSIVNLVPDGWTTTTLPAVTLSPNTTYWLVVNTDDATVRRTVNGGSQNFCYTFKPFGSMPDPYSIPGCFIGDLTYPLYLTFLTSGSAAGAVSQAQITLDQDGAMLLRNTTDSENAFQIQDAAGTSTILNVDNVNGRIAIGKTNAAYKLDIAGGDVNLSNGRSLRFGGLQALTMTNTGVTAVSSLAPGGSVRVQGDTFSVQDRNATHTNFGVNNTTGAALFTNNTDTAAAFQVQNAAGAALFTVDSAGNSITIGASSGTATPVLLYLANKNTTGDPAGAEGATYYNSTLGSFRCFYTGFWHNCADAEPQHSFTQNDEFLGGQASFTGQIGNLGWTPAAIGANGSLAVNPGTPTPSADRPGVLRVRTPAVANQGTTLLLGDGATGSVLIAKDNDLKTAVAVGATTSQVLRVGLHNESSATTQPISGVWWEANPAVSANWRYCYGNGTTATCAATSAAIAANTWVTLEIRVTAIGAGTSAATFVIDNAPFTVSAVTIDTAASVSPAYSCYATAASARDCFWDYFQLTGTTAARR